MKLISATLKNLLSFFHHLVTILWYSIIYYWKSIFFLPQLALSTLKNKANTDVTYIQGLITSKDAELRAAEEGLIGLKEVFSHLEMQHVKRFFLILKSP